MTIHDINTVSVAVWLREKGLWKQTGPSKMSGTFQVIIEDANTPPEVRAGLGELFSAVFGGSAETLRTTDPTWAGLVWSIVSGLTAVAPDAASLVDSFYALDGGRPYRDLTVEQFSAQRAEAQTASDSLAAKATLHQIPDFAYAEFVARYNTAKAGIDDGSLATAEQVNAVLVGV